MQGRTPAQHLENKLVCTCFTTGKLRQGKGHGALPEPLVPSHVSVPYRLRITCMAELEWRHFERSRAYNAAPAAPTNPSTAVGHSGESVHPLCAYASEEIRKSEPKNAKRRNIFIAIGLQMRLRCSAVCSRKYTATDAHLHRKVAYALLIDDQRERRAGGRSCRAPSRRPCHSHRVAARAAERRRPRQRTAAAASR